MITPMPRATALAPVLALLLVLAPTAEAVDVDAASFLAQCPGPIFVATDTTLVGTAKVSGDCTVGTEAGAAPGAQINLRQAKLTITGFFRIVGNASSLTVDRSKVTTGGALTLDSYAMTILRSTLTAGTDIVIPPRDSLSITDSSIAASGIVTVGGAGGLRHITDSDLSAGGAITVAPGASSVSGGPSQISLLRSTLFSDSSILIGGSTTTQTITESVLEARGTAEAVRVHGASSGARHISESIIRAPAGTISLAGRGALLVEDTEISSGAGPGTDPSTASIAVANGAETSPGATFRRTQFTASRGTLVFRGTGRHVFEDCKLKAGGVGGLGEGIEFASGDGKSITATTVQALAGKIHIVGFGDMTITDGSKLTAKGAGGIHMSNAGGRTVSDSQLDARLGPIELFGSGHLEVTESKLAARNAAGIHLGGGTAEINGSQVTTKGAVAALHSGIATVEAAKIQAGAGFLMATGSVGSNVLSSRVTASSITVQSHATTTVTDNTLKATTFEFSSTGVCTSTGNTPDVPCL